MEVVFNSKSKDYWELSNFYGGVESCYMKDRFLNPEIVALFNKFETCHKEEFLYYLKELQPDFWCKGGDYDENSLNKSELRAKGQAILKVIPFIENISTTDIINKLK